MINGDYIMIIAPKDYPGKLYRGKYCYEHLYVYWKTYGVIPNSDEIIHHRDGNKHNNDPKNLQLMLAKDHDKLHDKHLSNMVLLKCPVCGKLFIKTRRETLSKHYKVFYCSRQCCGKSTHVSKEALQHNIKYNILYEFVGNKEEFTNVDDFYNLYI